MVKTVAVAGLGAIGFAVAKRLDEGIPGLQLIAATARDVAAARAKVSGFAAPPAISELDAMADADIIVEAAGAGALRAVAASAIRRKSILVCCSVGALLDNMDLAQRAAVAGARIIVPSGALGGLDALRAAAEGEVRSVTIATRKPSAALAGAPHILRQGIDLDDIRSNTCIFRGSAREAAIGFPANLNVAAALALAGIGPDLTQVEIWADPAATCNSHTVTVDSAAVKFTMTLEGLPALGNPRTSQLTSLSVLATLRGLVSPFRIGA
jgi:aspartate dehydrogenase